MGVYIPSFRHQFAAPGLNAPSGGAIAAAAAGNALIGIGRGLNDSRNQRESLNTFADQFQDTNPQIAATLRNQAATVPLISFGGGGSRSGGGGGGAIGGKLLSFAIGNAESERDFGESQALSNLTHSNALTRMGIDRDNSIELAKLKSKLDGEGDSTLGGLLPQTGQRDLEGEARLTGESAVFQKFQERLGELDDGDPAKDLLVAAAKQKYGDGAINAMLDVNVVPDPAALHAILQDPTQSPEQKRLAQAQFISSGGSVSAANALVKESAQSVDLQALQSVLLDPDVSEEEKGQARAQAIEGGASVSAVNALTPEAQRLSAGEIITFQEAARAQAGLDELQAMGGDDFINTIAIGVVTTDRFGTVQVTRRPDPEAALALKSRANENRRMMERYREQNGGGTAKDTPVNMSGGAASPFPTDANDPATISENEKLQRLLGKGKKKVDSSGAAPQQQPAKAIHTPQTPAPLPGIDEPEIPEFNEEPMPRDFGGDLPDLGGPPAQTAVEKKGIISSRGNFGGTTEWKGGNTESQVTANLTPVKSRSGANFRVNKVVAGNFKGFLKELEATGYKIDAKNSGGFNWRKKRGGSSLSQHAYGNAIDINWNENRAFWGESDVISNIEGIAQMAANHGLIWGGLWNNNDTMHFEYHPSTGVPQRL